MRTEKKGRLLMRITIQSFCKAAKWNQSYLSGLRDRADVLALIGEGTVVDHTYLEEIVSLAAVRSDDPAVAIDPVRFAEHLPWSVAALTVKHLPLLILCFLSRWNNKDLLDFLRDISGGTNEWCPALHLEYPDVYRLLYQYSRYYYQAGVLATDHCNLQCDMCMFHSQEHTLYPFSGLRRRDRKQQEVLQDWMAAFTDQLLPQTSILFSASGEFLTSQHAVKYVQHAVKKGHVPRVLTNGLLLDREKAKVLIRSGVTQFIISVDGHQPDIYRKHRRGGELETVLRNIADLRILRESSGARFDICINTVLFEEFESSKEEILAFWKEKADKISFLVERVDYCGKPRKLFSPAAPVKMCFEPLNGPLLLSNGLISPCCSVAIAEWFENFPWLCHIRDVPLEKAVNVYYKMMLSEDSPLRRYCQKCHYWANSMQREGRSPYWEAYAFGC